MWMRLSRASRLDGVRQLRGSSGRWRSRPLPDEAPDQPPRYEPSLDDDRIIHTGFAALDAILARAVSRSRPASRSAATAPAAGRRSPCGSPRRPRRKARSWPGSTCRAASTRSRPSPAASASSGSSSSPRPAWTRGCRSRAVCWRAGRSTCSSSTCPAVDWRRPTSRPGSPIDSIDSPRSPGARRPCS